MKSDIHIQAMCIIPLISDDILISAIELSLTLLSSYFAGVLAFPKMLALMNLCHWFSTLLLDLSSMYFPVAQ